MLLPFHAIRYFAVLKFCAFSLSPSFPFSLVRGKFYDYDAILFLFDDVAMRATIKRA